MALNDLNKNAISFKKIVGKAHTQQTFAFTEESISSNIQIALTTIFGQPVNPLPATDGGLVSTGNTDNIVEKVRFEIEIIPDTEIGINQSQGYRLKLPISYSGVLSSKYSGGTFLHTALGKLQVVPSLYGTLLGDGTTEYDPVLFQTDGVTEITKFDSIDWILDPYNGILFVQDPPTGFDASASRPGFLEAFLYVGNYLDVVVTGTTQPKLTAGEGINESQLENNIVEVNLSGYTSPGNINISFSGSSGFIIEDLRPVSARTGVEYSQNLATTFGPRSHVDKGYVDAVATGLGVREAVLAATTIGEQIDLTGGTAISGTTGATIDGIVLPDGARVLIKNQSDARQNGIYIYSASTSGYTRSSDFDETSEAIAGAFTSVLTGDTNIRSLWVVATPNPILIDITEILWSQLAIPLVLTPGNGISIIGDVISVDGNAIAGTNLLWDGFDLNVILTGRNVGGGAGDIFRDKTGDTLNFKTIIGTGGITISANTDNVLISGNTGATGSIGDPEDGTYEDGLFTDFTPATPIGTAVDRFNEVLRALAPEPAPSLDNINSNDTFVSGNLSFGVSNSISGYTNVSTAAGNTAVDVNGTYVISSTREGIIATTLANGVLNDDVIGDIGGPGIPYEDNAFANGNLGSVVLELNGSTLDSIDLTSTTGATSSTNLAISVLKFVKFSNGDDFQTFNYRTGTFSISTGNMVNGFNYARVIHSGLTSGDIQTNFIEWVYDPDSNNISGGTAIITGITLTGVRRISGVEYNTGGNVNYQLDVLNIYRNIYSNSSSAIQYISRENLSDATEIIQQGTGITNSTGTTKILAALDTGQTNPQLTPVTIISTHDINSNIILGSVGISGRLRTSITIDHPFSTKEYSGSQATETGFLIYNINQITNNQDENFTGEVDRLRAQDYIPITYANINNGLEAWDSDENLISGNVFHNTGLLVFNGELLYPNAAYLTTTYGITTGNFSIITNGPALNPNYTSASGQRDYYRLFKSDNSSTQSTLTFEIVHTGNASSFLTDGGTGGTPTANLIKFEFLIKRVGGATHGWANPFASSGNPEGIANTSVSHSLGKTTVSCTLSTTPRVGDNDIVVVRLFVADGYSDRISNIEITNI